MESYTIESTKKKSRIPARLDLAQSATGLILGLFMWVHMLLVGSIILGKGSFNFVAKTMELSFLSDTGHGYPIAVFFAVLGVFTLFILHALLGVRKFPISWKQHRIVRDQMQMMNHTDTNLWYIQVVTGFFMFFLGSVHLYVMLTNPGSIDPYLSADRVVSYSMWPLYLVLLVCVELHATIGIYRLCMKWGWFSGKDARASRQKLKTWKNRLTIFFLSMGILALLVFVVIGIGHRDKVGERYESQAAAHAPAKEAAEVEKSPGLVKEKPPEVTAPKAEEKAVDSGHQASETVTPAAEPAPGDHGKAESHEKEALPGKEESHGTEAVPGTEVTQDGAKEAPQAETHEKEAAQGNDAAKDEAHMKEDAHGKTETHAGEEAHPAAPAHDNSHSVEKEGKVQ